MSLLPFGRVSMPAAMISRQVSLRGVAKFIHRLHGKPESAETGLDMTPSVRLNGVLHANESVGIERPVADRAGVFHGVVSSPWFDGRRVAVWLAT